jgi:hypothetical protein
MLKYPDFAQNLSSVKIGHGTVSLWLFRSLNALTGKAATSGPIEALWAGFALRVIRIFFVRASDNLVCHHGGARGVRLEEG